jgi:hypothetical protein
MAFSIAGCQSNSERDLMARDRRTQEDQMWAMQDYLQQYQQLICRFRSENASLRRQLNDERSAPVVEREPQPVPRTPSNPPATNRAPNLPGSPPPGIEKQTPSPNIEMPDIPPLKQGASIDTRNRYQSPAERESGQSEPDRYAQLASYEPPVDGPAARATSEPAASGTNISATSPDVLLSGEVIANDSGGGPRLMIDIESFDKSGHVAKFDGNVSLALLTSEGGVQRRLARWDFGPNDARSAVDTTASEPTMRFRVELPAGTQVDGATELWIKLAPTNGARLFSHAKLNLAKPGVFSSRTDKVWASEESVVAASYVDTSTQPAETTATVNESEWSTAKPGRPAILPPESEEATGGWKAASGPLPAAVESTKPPTTIWSEPQKSIQPASIQPASIKAAPVEVARKPPWTPDRPGTQSHAVGPSWSATR